jgi:hypothetical protein
MHRGQTEVREIAKRSDGRELLRGANMLRDLRANELAGLTKNGPFTDRQRALIGLDKTTGHWSVRGACKVFQEMKKDPTEFIKWQQRNAPPARPQRPTTQDTAARIRERLQERRYR